MSGIKVWDGEEQNVRDQGLEQRGAECQGSRFGTERSRMSGIKVLEQRGAECQGSRFGTERSRMSGSRFRTERSRMSEIKV